jgi:hypothetical protein
MKKVQLFLIVQCYIETMDGQLEEIRKIELQESKLINSPEPARVVLKDRVFKRFTSPTFKQS